MNACPTCASTHLRKSGFRKTSSGKHPLLRCVPEGHAFTGMEKFRHSSEEDRALAMKLEQEGLSVRAIARTVGRFPRAVTRWIEKKAPPSRPRTARLSAR